MISVLFLTLFTVIAASQSVIKNFSAGAVTRAKSGIEAAITPIISVMNL